MLDVKKLRNGMGLSQAAFSSRFGLDLATLRDWEHRRRSPAGPARTLLIVIEQAPDAVAAALAAAKPRRVA